MSGRLLTTLLAVLCVVPVCGQEFLDKHKEVLPVGNRHLLLRSDVNSGNVFTWGVAAIVSGYTNKAIGRNVFGTAYAVDIMKGRSDYAEVKMNSPLGFSARELFNDFAASLKVGYQSSFESAFNFGVFAYPAYKAHQFRAGGKEAGLNRYRYQRIGAGGGVLCVFGKIDSPYRVTLEASAHHNTPLDLSAGAFANADKNFLNKGVTSHYSVKFGGANAFQDIGLFVDIDHFDIFTDQISVVQPELAKLKNVCVGFSVVVTIGQAESR